VQVDVGAYGRLSVVKSSLDLTELAIERQHERVAAYCQAKGWNPVRFYQDIDPAYRRPGQKKPPPREDFERSLTDIEAGITHGIVFFKLDRFVRDHGDFERALAVCEAHQAVLASVTEPLDTSSPMGEAIARLLVTFARLESQTMGLRVAAQAEQQARLGQPWRGGRHRPYAYERDGVTVIGEEAAVVQEVTARLLAGDSEGAVVRWLEDQAIPAPAGGHWSRQKLRSMLTNPRLAGWRRYHGEILDGVEAVWPPVLDKETFERLGRLFNQRTQPGRPAIRWLLSGIVACGPCESLLEVRGHAAGTRYVCDSQAQRAGRDEPGCGKVSVVAEPVDLLVAERVLDRLAGPRLARARRQLDTAELRALSDRREQDRMALVEAARERFVTRTLTPPAYLQVKGELERRIADADRRLAADSSAEVLEGLPRLRGDLDKAWEAADIERRREIVRAVVARVVIQPATRRGAGLDPDRVVIPKDTWKV